MITQHAPAPLNAPPRCGLWSGPRRSAAVLFDPVTHRQRVLSLANTEQPRATLLDWLAEHGAHLVIPDTLLAQPGLAHPNQLPVAVWIAPSALLEAIRFTSGLTTRAPKHTAALLARWPTAPALRPFLRRLSASPHPEQLSLL